MADRVSTLDNGYVSGDLSVFPNAIDSTDELYEVRNDAETTLYQALTYNGSFIVVESAASFPDKGLIKINDELIYYNEHTSNIFKDLKRGFAGSKQNYHNVGARVYNPVAAEHHNACKDALYNIQHYVGLKESPEEGTYNYRLTQIERKYLTPKPSFKGYPRKGNSPLTVAFKNFSMSEAARFLWDFGDGGYSDESNPTHTYTTEGEFTVQLTMLTALGGSGVITKRNYINVNNDKESGFIYVTPASGTTATTFIFIDQTDGDIIQRHWNFGDGNKSSVVDPDVHTITHTYTTAGSYDVTLLVVYADQSVKRVNLPDSILVST